LRSLMLLHWKSIDNQGVFACDGMIELGHVIMSNRGGASSSSHQSTLVHVATNSLHYYFPAARGSRLTELVCACGAICTISHLQACNIDRHHAQLHRSIMTYLSTTCCSPAWLIDNNNTTMSSMMLSLFPTPTPHPHTHGDDIDITLDDIAHHRTLMMIGAFTSTQSNAAAKALGLVDSNDVRDVMSRIRQLCLEHIGNIYTLLIQKALALAMP
jgi:hypothetical protein